MIRCNKVRLGGQIVARPRAPGLGALDKTRKYRSGAAAADRLIGREGRVHRSIGFELTILPKHFGRAIFRTAMAHVGGGAFPWTVRQLNFVSADFLQVGRLRELSTVGRRVAYHDHDAGRRWATRQQRAFFVDASLRSGAGRGSEARTKTRRAFYDNTSRTAQIYRGGVLARFEPSPIH